MKTSRLILTCILLTFIAALPAMAGPRTFVSGLGNDANPGTREQPKRTFASALTVTNAGGQIVALDSAGYGSSTLTINKSVSIIVPPGVAGFITVSGSSDAIIINAAANDVVSIRGLIIENSNPSDFVRGIRCNTVGTLTVEDCAIRNFGFGIFFIQSIPGHLQVHGGSLRENTHGIYFQQGGSAALDAIVTGCLVENNSNGIVAIAGNGGTARLTIGDCTISGNGTGVISEHAGATAYLDNCRLSNNTRGINTAGTGALISLGNNSFTNNATNGAFTSTTPRF